MAGGLAHGRLQREIAAVQKDKDSGVALELGDDGKLDKLTGVIPGPADTPYEGGTFRISIEVPSQYPFSPPKMKFLNKVWHPNISSQTGAICLDILKDAWTPALSLRSALISLQALLSDPVPDDPQDAQVARQYLSDRAAWTFKAAEWTKLYAGGPGPKPGAGGAGGGGGGAGEGAAAPAPAPAPPADPRVATIVAMGFTVERAEAALARFGGDVEQAVNSLIG